MFLFIFMRFIQTSPVTFSLHFTERCHRRLVGWITLSLLSIDALATAPWRAARIHTPAPVGWTCTSEKQSGTISTASKYGACVCNTEQQEKAQLDIERLKYAEI